MGPNSQTEVRLVGGRSDHLSARPAHPVRGVNTRLARFKRGVTLAAWLAYMWSHSRTFSRVRVVPKSLYAGSDVIGHVRPAVRKTRKRVK